MSKYIDADLLIRKIKGQIRLENLNFAALGGGGQTFCINTLEWVLKQIDSLQREQQEVDLEEEITNFIQAHYHIRYDNTLENGNDPLTVSDFEDIARHFYELKNDLSIHDLELLHTFLYAVKNNKQGAFTFTRLSDEQYQEVLRRFKNAK